MTEERPANRLVGETSPYLLQHAHNPVDWYPWGAEALAKAKRENKPIFLSVGYSTCYWCHVAEKTLYADPAIAKLMNDWFVNIKVDREQRPDLDRIYMLATQFLTGRGGWPNNVFLTPDLKPFFAGSYFPPADDAFGRPGFTTVLKSVHDAWVNRSERVQETAAKVHAALERYRQASERGAEAPFEPSDWLARAATDLQRHADRKYGGFPSGSGTKFPKAPSLEMLLARYVASRDPRDLEVLSGALDAMAYGGVNDQLAGGFHRYSTEPSWSIPHFEKMIYDNAQLLKTYARAYEATGRALYRHIASTLSDYLVREMMAPEGGFYSAQDAEVDGEEGASYVWTHREIASALGQTDAERFFGVYALVPLPEQSGERVVSAEERGVLRVRLPIEQTLRRSGQQDPAGMLATLAPLRTKLLAVRDRRKQPLRDDKLLVGMNGLAIEAFAEAARIVRNPRDADVARRAAERIWASAYDPASGRLKHEIFRGRSQLDGYLEDYALFGRGLMALHGVTKEPIWQTRAGALAGTIVGSFLRPDGSLATTAYEKELLVALPDAGDNVQPSGTSATVDLLLRLDRATGSSRYAPAVERIVRGLSGRIRDEPGGWPILIAAVSSGDLVASTARAAAGASGPTRAGAAVPDSAAVVHASAVARRNNERDEIVVTLKIDAGYHVNANPASYDYLIPTSVSFEGIVPARMRYPEPVLFRPSFAREGLKVYAGSVVLAAELPRGALQASGTIRATVHVQACDDEVCFPPAKIPVTISR